MRRLVAKRRLVSIAARLDDLFFLGLPLRPVDGGA